MSRIVPAGQHLQAAEALARRMCELAPLALSAGKQMRNRLARLAPEHDEQATKTVIMLQATKDFPEGVAAFKDRRRPSFTGR